MPSSRHERALGLLLCLLALVGALAAPRGLVLCVGENGHIAIETAVETTPCGVPLREGNALGAPPVEACSDTALTQTAIRSSIDPESAAPLALAALIPAPTPRASAPTLTRARAPIFPSQTLEAQRTIVLLV